MQLLNTRAALLCAAVLLTAATSAHSGAWVQPRDSYYFKLSVSYLDTDRELSAGGDEVDILSGEDLLTNASYRDITVGAYVEYGITDRLTTMASLPFKILTSKRTELSDVVPDLRREVDATSGGLGDLTLGVRYPLLPTASSKFPLSIQGSLKFPLGYDNRPDNMGPPLGSGRVDVEGLLLTGASLYPFPGYLTGGFGYRVRGGDVDDEILFNAEAGATWHRFGARIGIDGVYSTGEPPDLSTAGDGRVSSSVVVTEQDILKLTPAINILLSDEVTFVLEAFHVIDGKNTVTGTTWSAGISFQQ